jgi:hypothetical protein
VAQSRRYDRRGGCGADKNEPGSVDGFTVRMARVREVSTHALCAADLPEWFQHMSARSYVLPLSCDTAVTTCVEGLSEAHLTLSS